MQGRGQRQRGTCETGDACSTARCGAWFTWEATWDTRDGRCVLDRPLWGVVYARERSEATWDAQDGRCVLDRLLWGMVTWEATWDTRDGRCVLDHPLWGM